MPLKFWRKTVPSAWHREVFNKCLLNRNQLPTWLLVCIFYVPNSPRGMLRGQNIPMRTPMLSPFCLAQPKDSISDHDMNRCSSTMSGHHCLSPGPFRYPSNWSPLVYSCPLNPISSEQQVKNIGSSQSPPWYWWLAIAFIKNSVPQTIKFCMTGPSGSSPASPHSLGFRSFLDRMCHAPSCCNATIRGVSSTWNLVSYFSHGCLLRSLQLLAWTWHSQRGHSWIFGLKELPASIFSHIIWCSLPSTPTAQCSYLFYCLSLHECAFCECRDNACFVHYCFQSVDHTTSSIKFVLKQGVPGRLSWWRLWGC